MSSDSSGAKSEFIDRPCELFDFGMRLTASEKVKLKYLVKLIRSTVPAAGKFLQLTRSITISETLTDLSVCYMRLLFKTCYRWFN